MEYFKIFSTVIEKEMRKFNLDAEVYSATIPHITAFLDENFDVGYNRCVYMFRYATINMYFFKECMKEFFLEFVAIKDLLLTWKSYSDVKVCSLSCGPGLDYLGFVLTLFEYDQFFPPIFNSITVISKHGAWRNTVNFIVEVMKHRLFVSNVASTSLKYENIDVIQGDILKQISEKSLESLRDANVILMMKTLNLTAPPDEEKSILKKLTELISSLRSEAIIFCIDTKPSLALLSKALASFPGKFLHGPTHSTTRLPFSFPDGNEYRPVFSARGVFFVWQKLSSYPSVLNLPVSAFAIPLTSKLCVSPTEVVISANKDSKEEKSTVSHCGDGEESTFPIPCAAEDASIMERKVSEILPWKEFPTGKIPWGEIFWENASQTTRESLKSLMFLKKQNLEPPWIGAFLNLYEKENTLKAPGSPTEPEIVNSSPQSVVESGTYTSEASAGVFQTLMSETANELNDTLLISDCTDQEHILNKESISIDLSKTSSPDTDLLDASTSGYQTSTNCDSSLANNSCEELTDEIALICAGIDEQANGTPIISKIANSSLPPLKCDSIEKKNHCDSVIANNFLDQGLTGENLTSHTAVEEQVNVAPLITNNANSLQMPIQCDSVKKKVQKSKEATVTKTSKANELSLGTKFTQTQTDSPTSSTPNDNTSSIKALTERVRQLVTSFENVLANQNELRSCGINSNGCRNNFHHQHHSESMYTCDGIRPSCSTPLDNSDGSTLQNSSSIYSEIDAERKYMFHQCNASQNRHQCCQARCEMRPLCGCPMQCHSQPCHYQHVQKCHIASCRLPCGKSQSLINSAQPNIVIPLQNISNDVLLQVISALKTGSKAG